MNGVFDPIPSAGKEPKYHQMVLDSVQQAQEFRSKAMVWQFVPDGSRYKLYRVGMNGTGEYLVVGDYETFNPNIRHLNLSTSAADGTSFTVTTVEEGTQKYLLLSCEKRDIVFSYTYYPNIRHLNLSTSAADGTSFTVTTVEEGTQKYLLLSCEKRDIVFSYTYYLALNETGFYAKKGRDTKTHFYLVSDARGVGTVRGETPAGTDINLFDYWVTKEDESGPPTNANGGINRGHRLHFTYFGEGSEGDINHWTGPDSGKTGGVLQGIVQNRNANGGINRGHRLHFTYFGEGSEGDINHWTGPDSGKTGGVLQGIVQNRKGKEGYPVLSHNGESLDYLFDPTRKDPTVRREYVNVGNLLQVDEEGYFYYDSKKNFAQYGESLDYLFDPTRKDPTVRREYVNVGNLLQVDEEGYFYYDSKKNFAQFDQNKNQFILYENPRVNPGMFFPFDRYEDLQWETNPDFGSGHGLNHYFGLTLTTRFINRDGGYVDSQMKKPMTFEFSGDDDVWIFIDGILAADLGGIHDAANVKIDFQKGTVTISRVYDPNGSAPQVRTFAEIFRGENAPPLQDGRLKDNSSHTLEFYYLERGGAKSNMYLKYNLTSIPTTGVYKVDQHGAPIPGAKFAVYLEFYYLERGGAKSNMYLKYNLTSIPTTGVYKVDQHGAPIPGAKFAVYAARKDPSGEYQYLDQLGGSVVNRGDFQFPTYDADGSIIGKDGKVLVKALYTGTTNAGGEMIFQDEFGGVFSSQHMMQTEAL